MAVVFYFNLSLQDDKYLINENSIPPQADQTLESGLQEDKNLQIEAPNKGLSNIIGKDITFLEDQLGKPDRVDPSAYGYDWWIYKVNSTNYIQVGVEKEVVVTLYGIGSDLTVTPFKIGQPVKEIYSSVPIEMNISLEYNGSSYRFEMTDNDMNTQPLIQMGNFYVQLNMDRFEGTLSSVRYMDTETLIKLRPYELVYRGELLEATSPQENEREIEAGREKQIFDITNVIRQIHQIKPLTWDEKTSKVALAHSTDMYENSDFSHTSKMYGELSDRLGTGEVIYELAGENIAANYTDAPAVMEGWLNSKVHRETLLDEQFTHIGVGVYRKHYTQDFIQVLEE